MAKDGEGKKGHGLTVKKAEDSSEWYTQVLDRAELIEYTDVSGCYVLRPRLYAMWEIAKEYFDKKIKASGVQNAYFPLFIPESYLKKEAEHVEGFSPEVAWVTHSGDNEMAEKLAIRPTSETIMYPSYKKWIRSWRDLPLRLNQWCNVVRWEFSHPVPLLRSREFLWQEGHTVFATREEAWKEVLEILDYYKDVFEDLYAIPVFKGTKTEKEKFAGADSTTSVEIFLPTGKAIQGATSHLLGQNFAKAFDITYLDKDEKIQHAWQNSWGFSTRSLGTMIMFHSDDKGLVLPPKISPNKIAIVPILFEKTKEIVLKKVNELGKQLKEFNPIIDDREEFSPGYKFNEWEMKGVPIRLEIGPRDLENNQAILVRRDTGEKETVKLDDLKKEITLTLEAIQENLFKNAKKFIEENTITTTSWDELVQAIKDKKLVKTVWCGETECEDWIKDKTGGAKILNIPFDQPHIKDNCPQCGKEGKYEVYIAKSY
ncbi:proline--tRNA ligase [Candidatus Woesearchaeota archaeon]|nr:proline--tRNA ligase [Candidatus Woesearchaeota archaeon]